MALVQYTKPPLSFADQVINLEKKGLNFNDKPRAEIRLASISYYRLSGYWYPFRVRDERNNVTNQFEPGTNFDEVIFLYEWDRQLRSLVLDAIERVEIAVRTQFTYHIGHKYGAFGHTDAQNFHPKFNHQNWLSKLEDEARRSSDDFIRHYQSKYTGFPTVPIWMLTEVMSLGALSFGYKGLINDRSKGVEDKKAVAQHFNIHHKKLSDWLHTLTYVRNICAHHSRLWNRSLAIRPDKTGDTRWLAPITPRNDRIFYVLLMLRHLLRAVGNGDDWVQHVNQLLEQLAHSGKWRSAMGLPENWRGHPLWK
ncbi:Abi family protein [Lacimicrobium alkaliphilum]|uniref:ABC transporter permease n=1 Tax=Lacimicrobium alkaliphilum TaxID=1526571 RepID=A0ABQ1RHU9_9ALTE|nr:Abi family protein [Lacimicrobium alkaliphilum]GGD70875.1 ABC transporter permease [Lacimicrobium alkaliphilum]